MNFLTLLAGGFQLNISLVMSGPLWGMGIYVLHIFLNKTFEILVKA